MRIGLDIDNVISNFDDTLTKEYLKHDKELRNNGIINKDKYITRGMFDWSEEENKEFYYSNIERIAKLLKPIKESVYYIKKLKQEGNEIYIISGRENGEYTNAFKMTKEWLDKYEIPYDKIILTDTHSQHQKTEECIKNNIDIMIDDSVDKCKDLENNGITTYMMNTRFNQNVEFKNRVSKWKEIYYKISNNHENTNQEKVNVILDTDIYNECDDQFALSYLIKTQDKFNIEAITVAPFHHHNSISIPEGTEESYQEVLKICKWLNFETKDRVFRGATDFIEEGYEETNEAVEKIIEIAHRNDKTYILSIGAITNIALAIKKDPSIISKIEVIWLGGNSFLNENNEETNFKDVQAVRIVFESKVKLTVIPTKNVSSNLRTSIYEIEHFLKGKSEICDYLCKRFRNDGFNGIQERRVIWDISVVAYMIDKRWFETREISCPRIKEDTAYEMAQNNHKITIVDYLDVDKIYTDLFQKLGN